MEAATYKKQVELLLKVLPEVAKESCFALHGGTAINLFIRDMPRLSVDIDLTYVPIEDRSTSLDKIEAALRRIKERTVLVVAKARVTAPSEKGKLYISSQGVAIKLEVNLVGRGTIVDPVRLPLCQKAQEEFDVFTDIPVIPMGQLYGGKICAALDRQHPRDLFDVRYLLANEGFSNEVKAGFLLALISHDRPIRELLQPNFQDQRSALRNQFGGMTDEEFTYEAYEETRMTLVETIRGGLSKEDIDFLLSVKNLAPKWSSYDFERFPAVRWKLKNLQDLKENNPKKFRELYESLASLLER